jgi:hypothetical protein
MSTNTEPESDEPRHPAVNVTGALARARKARHHPDCHCRNYQSRWCNALDALWSRAVDRELDSLVPKETGCV